MLSKERRDLDVLLLSLRPTVRIKPAFGTLRSPGNPRIPGRSGLDGATGCSVFSGRLCEPGVVLRAQSQTDIRGQPLEQRAGVPRLSFVTFFSSQCPSGNRG